MKIVVDTPKSKFIKVLCKKCKNEQIIFNKASTVVKCIKCKEVLACPTGGVVSLKEAKVLRFLS